VDLGVTARQDGRSGTVGTNDLSTSGLKAAIARAAEMRDLMPVDPEAVEMLPAQKYPALEKYDDATALARAADRAAGVKATLGLAQRRSLTSAGFFENGVSHRAIGNSRGNFESRIAKCEPRNQPKNSKFEIRSSKCFLISEPPEPGSAGFSLPCPREGLPSAARTRLRA
jgi:hypothetical protein